MYKILMMIQVIIMKILAKCKFGGETMIRQFAKFSLPPKLVVVRYVLKEKIRFKGHMDSFASILLES